MNCWTMRISVMIIAVLGEALPTVGDVIGIDVARASFLEANQLEGASSNAVDEAGAYFIVSLGTNVFPVAETNLVRSQMGNWTVHYMFNVNPSFWYTSFIMSDGQVWDANDTNVVSYMKAEHPGILETDVRVSVLDDASKFLYRGCAISSAHSIAGYADGQLSSNIVADIGAAWEASNAVPLVRYYWNPEDGNLWRGVLELTPSNTLMDVVFTNMATHVGERIGPFM